MKPTARQRSSAVHASASDFTWRLCDLGERCSFSALPKAYYQWPFATRPLPQAGFSLPVLLPCRGPLPPAICDPPTAAGRFLASCPASLPKANCHRPFATRPLPHAGFSLPVLLPCRRPTATGHLRLAHCAGRFECLQSVRHSGSNTYSPLSQPRISRAHRCDSCAR
jgi:hypothetical protein